MKDLWHVVKSGVMKEEEGWGGQGDHPAPSVPRRGAAPAWLPHSLPQTRLFFVMTCSYTRLAFTFVHIGTL